ncbi:DNA helicase, partial [Trinorchestia longiramus]
VLGKILTGSKKGEHAFIPRINLVPSDTNLPFNFCRRQFPLIPAFAMTINKSQGQSFSNVGVYLPSPVFSHGQLYVALSRIRNRNNIKIVIK